MRARFKTYKRGKRRRPTGDELVRGAGDHPPGSQAGVKRVVLRK